MKKYINKDNTSLNESKSLSSKLNEIKTAFLTNNFNIIQLKLNSFSSSQLNNLINPQTSQNLFFLAAQTLPDALSIKVVKLLSAKNLSPHSLDTYSQSPLYYACRDGKYHLASFLIDQFHLKVNSPDIFGQTPIFYSVREGHYSLCELLLSKGIYINYTDIKGQNCIFYAVMYNRKNILTLLIENGGDINKIDNYGNTPLSIAKSYGNDDIQKILLAQGAIDIERIDKRKKNNFISNKYSYIKGSNEQRKREISIEENNEENIKNKYVLVRVLPDMKGKFHMKRMEKNEIKKLFDECPKVERLITDEGERWEFIKKNKCKELYRMQWEEIAKGVIKEMWELDKSALFRHFVDDSIFGLGKYYEVIKKPMCFDVIKKKINNELYTNAKEFVSDVNLVFQNCFQFNKDNGKIVQFCKNIQEFFNKRVKETKLDLFLVDDDEDFMH